MKNVLLIGAGKSSTFLISYLNKLPGQSIRITVADKDPEAARKAVKGYTNVQSVKLDLENKTLLNELVKSSTLVISFLPAQLHPVIGNVCLDLNRNFLTPSYVSPELQILGEKFNQKGLICLHETGLDPGIDHASACNLFHTLESRGCTVKSFESATGGLISPESADNPWQYKFTWNPKGIIQAGTSGARYLTDNQVKILTHHRLFLHAEPFNTGEQQAFEAYPNRDALLYKNLYRLDNVESIVRKTIRPAGFSKAWYFLLQLGYLSDSLLVNEDGTLTWQELTKMFLPPGKGSIKNQAASFLNTSNHENSFQMLAWTGIFENETLPLKNASPVQQISALLEKKWAMKPDDRDMILMVHNTKYFENGKLLLRQSKLKRTGKNEHQTAMAELVGIPAGICARLILENKIRTKGIVTPVNPEVYLPMMRELTETGIHFEENEWEVNE
jgi:saccharopine dehydrogenase-like NADP-dependent oxidoreductase